MGTNDLVKETRADLSSNRRPALYWLSPTITAARAYGLDVLDGVYNNFKDSTATAAMRAWPRAGLRRQDLIIPIRSPAPTRCSRRRAARWHSPKKIIAAFDQPESRGKGVITGATAAWFELICMAEDGAAARVAG